MLYRYVYNLQTQTRLRFLLKWSIGLHINSKREKRRMKKMRQDADERENGKVHREKEWQIQNMCWKADYEYKIKV